MRWLVILALGIAVAVGYSGIRDSMIPWASSDQPAWQTAEAPRLFVAATEIVGMNRAITGDTIEFQGKIFHLSGLTCPPPVTEPGIEAKALMNTFLRAPHMECFTTSSGEGTCSRDGRNTASGTDFAEGMRKSGFCQ